MQPTETLFGNTLRDYALAAAIFAGGTAVLFLLQKILFGRLKSWARTTPGKLDDMAISVFEKSLLPLCYLAAFYFAAHQLVLAPLIARLVHDLTVVVLTLQVARFALAVSYYFTQEWLLKEGKGVIASKSILTLFRIVIWMLAVVFALDNLGFDVNAVIAGLGIGGVAVALAAQTILGDLFNYFVIFFDRPFEEGDAIVAGDIRGTIEHIGIKTTKIASLSGEQIICANSFLTSTQIRNYKRMARRRVELKLGVIYETGSSKLKGATALIRKIIEARTDTVFDRSHFAYFGDFGLTLETVYYVLGNDYNKYMDIQETVNLAIMEAFSREGIEFAYPTQVVYHQPKAA